MKKVLVSLFIYETSYRIFQISLLGLLTINFGCNETELKKKQSVDQLLFQIKAQIEIIKDKNPLANGRTQSVIDPENPENPYDYYGETYAYIDANYSAYDYYEANTGQSYELVRDGYVNSISNYLTTQNIIVENYSPNVTEQLKTDFDTYGFDYLLNQGYNEGRITYNTKQLLSSYYNYYENEEIDAATFNDIALIFENNIIEAQILSDTEEEHTLSFISVVKYDNSIYGDELVTSRKRCVQRALGGFILGSLVSSPGAGFLAGAFFLISCLFWE